MIKERHEYDKKIYRLLTIINKLESGGMARTQELAHRFNVTPRTIQRDLELLDMTGFLIASPEKGVHTFVNGFSLKKMKLTTEEASLLSFLNEIVRSLGSRFEESFSRILKKVVQEEYDSPYFAKIPEGVKLGADYTFLEDLEKAILDNIKIKIKYAVDNKEKYFKKVWPLKIIFFDGFWYLLTRMDHKNWVLKLRLDKVGGIELLSERFHMPENLKTILSQSVNAWLNEKRDKRALLKIDKDAAPYFRKMKYFPLQKVKKESKDGSILIETRYCQDMEIRPTVLRWMPHIKIVKPDTLRKEIGLIIREYEKR